MYILNYRFKQETSNRKKHLENQKEGRKEEVSALVRKDKTINKQINNNIWSYKSILF